jgi:hypothetical protein
MRKIILIPLCLIFLISFSDCANKNNAPQLTPAAVTAYNKTQFSDAIGSLQLAAENATTTIDTKTNKPLLKVNTARIIVQFCVGANKTLAASDTGWLASIQAAYQDAKSQLSPSELITFGPYLDTFEIVLSAVTGS